MAKPGRPSTYSLEIAQAICERISLGENVNQICQDDGFPERSTIYKWLGLHKEFTDLYARARETRADSRADRIDEVCRKVESKELDPNAGKVIIDALKWQAGKEKPRSYGDRITQEHVGPNGGPIQYQNLAEDEVDRRLEELAAKLGDQPPVVH